MDIPKQPTEQYKNIIKELNKANLILSLAIDRYSQACGNLAYQFESGGTGARELANHAMRELLTLVSYDQKYHQAKIHLRRVRNQCPKIVPIHVLPFEVLSRIFCSVDYCYMSKDGIDLCGSRNTSTAPEIYLQVCSWWRRVAMGSPHLWNHIDLIPSERCNIQALGRARLFAAQADWAPLDIHTGAGQDKRGWAWGQVDHEFLDFCASVSSRIQSLELTCSTSSRAIQLLLENILPSAITPGAVTRLHINAGAFSSNPSFLVASSQGQSRSTPRVSPSIELLTVNENRLEDFLRPITGMWLDSVYPHWDSRAYFGLVELHLIGKQRPHITISEQQLANILRASPCLQLLHYGLEFWQEASYYAPSPVKLDYLEVLRLERLLPHSQASVLEMIIPGPKPLQLAIKLRDNLIPQTPYHTALSDFLSRSFGTQLYLEGVGSNFEPFELLRQSPLDVLVLHDFILGKKYTNQPDTQQYSRIRVLHMIQCRFTWEGFKNLVAFHSIQKLASRLGIVVSGVSCDSDNYYEGKMKEICPSVEFPGDDRHFLTEGW